MGNKRILITGAAGFLGSHLCDRFIKEEFHVIGMDNLITGKYGDVVVVIVRTGEPGDSHAMTAFVVEKGTER